MVRPQTDDQVIDPRVVVRIASDLCAHHIIDRSTFKQVREEAHLSHDNYVLTHYFESMASVSYGESYRQLAYLFGTAAISILLSYSRQSMSIEDRSLIIENGINVLQTMIFLFNIYNITKSTTLDRKAGKLKKEAEALQVSRSYYE